MAEAPKAYCFIVLNFRGQTRWAWDTSPVALSNTLSSSTVSKQCLLQRYLLGESSLQIQQLSFRILSIDNLSVSHVKKPKFTFTYFPEQLKIREIKDPRKFSAIRYVQIHIMFITCFTYYM